MHETWLASGIAVLEADGRVAGVNEALAAWLGASPASVKGQVFSELLGRKQTGWQSALESFLDRNEGFGRLQLRDNNGPAFVGLNVELCVHGGTRFLHFESVMSPMNGIGELLPVQGWGAKVNHHDLQRLLRSETRLDEVMNRSPEIVFKQRPDFSFEFINPEIEELTGIPSSNFEVQPGLFWEIVHEADAESLAAHLHSDELSAVSRSTTYRIRHVRTGRITYLWEYRRTVRRTDGSILGSEGVWLDVTRQTIAERRLLTMSWRESLGLLTMGLVHDFCNILTGIVGLSETFQSNPQLDDSVRSGMSLIRETAMRGSQMAQRIRQFHQAAPGEKTYCDLNELVSSLVESLQKMLPRRIQVKTELVGGKLPVYVDMVALQQVVTNLALNGAEAMPGGGALVFRTGRHEHLPDTPNLVGTRPHPPAISLSVQDSGTGIPDRFLSSIFDAFATTKPLGKGSGFGLYNAWLFVEKHNAAISVETKERQGSTFHLWFGEANFKEAPSIAEAVGRTRHTLLVAGPPGEALEKMSTLLRENRYYVVPASDEAFALETLYSPHFELTGLIELASAGISQEISLCERVRAHKLSMKTILVLTDGNQRDLEERFPGRADAIVPVDIDPQEFLIRLRSTLKDP